MIPRSVKVILPADRPRISASAAPRFPRVGRFCQIHSSHYVIRIEPKVHIHIGSQKVRLDLYPVKRGVCRLLKDVLYRDKDSIPQNVAVCWKKNLPKHRDECWYLMTDLNRPARELVTLYGKRMQIQEFFWDPGGPRANATAGVCAIRA